MKNENLGRLSRSLAVAFMAGVPLALGTAACGEESGEADPAEPAAQSTHEPEAEAAPAAEPQEVAEATAETAALSWMEADAAASKVSFHFISGFNANNSAWNFNGYYDGGATVVVPVGWDVAMALLNQDGNYPHSMVVTEAYGRDSIPDQAAGGEAAIRRAYTTGPLEGLFAGEEETFRFKAKEAGSYYLLCGVPGHAVAGMWIKFEIRAEADAPFVEIAEGVPEGRS